MFWRYTKEGTPMLLPIVCYDQEDMQTHFRTDEFIFGEQILVCPIQEPNAQGRRMYIPRGHWYNYWSDEIIEGGREKWVVADIDTIPLFVKAGAIIPKYPVQQYVGELEIKELLLDVYFTEGEENSTVYEDAEDGYTYENGKYSLRNFKLLGKEGELKIQQFKDGAFLTSYETFKIKLHGLPFKIGKVQVDNEKVSIVDVMPKGDQTIYVSKDFTQLRITAE